MEEKIVYRTTVKRNATASEFTKYLLEYQTMLASFIYNTEEASSIIKENNEAIERTIATKKADKKLWG